MENASKALIIAGAILISIVIISLGVVIIGQGQDVVNDSNMDKQKISSWNQQFMQYEGTSVSGSNVNTLINDVISNNIIATRDGNTNKVISLVGSTPSGKTAANTPTFTNGYACIIAEGLSSAGTQGTTGTKACTKKAKPGVTYTVTAKNNKDGYVSYFKIEPNS